MDEIKEDYELKRRAQRKVNEEKLWSGFLGNVCSGVAAPRAANDTAWKNSNWPMRRQVQGCWRGIHEAVDQSRNSHDLDW